MNRFCELCRINESGYARIKIVAEIAMMVAMMMVSLFLLPVCEVRNSLRLAVFFMVIISNLPK